MGTVGRTWFRDLTGHRYGMLTVLSFHSQVGNVRKWNCRCDCGTECVKYGHQIRAGKVVSCGCEQKRRASVTGKKNAYDLVGIKFERLDVISRVGSNLHGKSTWLCRCDCGKEVVVSTSALKSGNTKSCGCIQKETMHMIRWNPDLSQEDRETNRNREMAVPGLHLWRKKVYRRDKWTCVICGYKGRSIVAHHVESWSQNRDLRLEVSNGITVCVDCHKEFHSHYGYGKNTLEQWNRFVSLKQIGVAI